LVAVSIMIAYIIMEYMIPFLRNIKWVENSASAYYLAYSWLEDWLYFRYTNTWELEIKDTGALISLWNYGYTSTESEYETISSWYQYETISSGKTLPAPWTWDSEYPDNENNYWNYNTISMWNPIQLSVWYWYITSIDDLKISFQVPMVDHIKREIYSWNENVINWQLSSETQTLNSISESLIKSLDIRQWDDSEKKIKMSDKNWRLINWETKRFYDFYNENCGDGKRCILRFSVINPIKQSNGADIPYLEWKLLTTHNIPLRYSRIESTWKSYWFARTLNIRVPQSTIAEALDFTVFQ
jgi:hypothetical protein